MSPSDCKVWRHCLCLMGFVLGTTQIHGAPAIYANPNLPTENERVILTIRLEDQAETTQTVRVSVHDQDGERVMSEDLAVVYTPERGQASTTWGAGKNGLYRVSLSSETFPEKDMLLPVLCRERVLDFAWYSHRPWIRWATVFTSCNEDAMPVLRLRGIKGLKWRGGLREPKDGHYGTLEETRRWARAYYRAPDDFPFDGYGIDEFGGYPQSLEEEHTHAWLRGLIDARKDFPKDFYVAGWHCGGVRDEAVGLYKDALDLALLESYVFHWVPKELGTENIYEDLRNRLISTRGADALVRSYGSPCKALLSLDITGGKGTTAPNLGEFEQVVRRIRRICPEMRGIGFFNGSATHEQVERFAHDICLEYFIKPVVTFQPNSVWIERRDGQRMLVAAVSNIGGMDSGPVTVSIKVNGKSVAAKALDSVPAGHDRRNNRAFLSLDWTPPRSGTYRIEAEIVDAPGSTVLDPIVREERFLRP